MANDRIFIRHLASGEMRLLVRHHGGAVVSFVDEPSIESLEEWMGRLLAEHFQAGANLGPSCPFELVIEGEL